MIEVASISGNHKNTLNSSLSIIERNLRSIKNDLELDSTSEQEAILYKRDYDIDDRAKPAMLKVIASMLSEIKDIKNEFELETETEQVSKRSAALMSEMWVILEDLKPNKLKAYGSVSDREKKLIEPHITRMLKELEEIENAFKKYKIQKHK